MPLQPLNVHRPVLASPSSAPPNQYGSPGCPDSTLAQPPLGTYRSGSMDTGNTVAGSASIPRSGTTVIAFPASSNRPAACRVPASHMAGAEDVNTLVPAASTSSTDPPAPGRGESPFVASPYRIAASRGSAAASRFFTTTTCWNPVGLAVSLR